MKMDSLRGAVRPLLTLGGFIVVSALTLQGKLAAGEYSVMVTGIVSYWFGTRNSTPK